MTGIDWDWVKKEALRTEKIDAFLEILNECIKKAKSLTKPKYIFEEKNITALGTEFIKLEGGVKFLTRKIPPSIKGAKKLVLFIVTIGDSIEKEAGVLTAGKDPLGGYLLDRLGSFAVESLAENLEKRLRKEYSNKNKSLSSRFSPGYCDWPIEEQFKLSKVIDFSKAGVKLTEGCMMVPKKSISAIAAVAGKSVFKDSVSGCNICEKTDCGFRRNIVADV